MTENPAKSAGAFRTSLEARLNNQAKQTGIALDRLRKRVTFDRLLARIFSHADQPFLLKGGYAMELRYAKARATNDIDFTYVRRTGAMGQAVRELIHSDLLRYARTNLNDYFIFDIGTPLDLDIQAPFGGARIPITAIIDGRFFERFPLDVGGDIVVSGIEKFTVPDWLHFIGVAPATVTMISSEQQFAEKVHAYSAVRESPNTRVKDLIDMLLFVRGRPLNFSGTLRALHEVFKTRGYAHPKTLSHPPEEWIKRYRSLAAQCGLPTDMTQGFEEVRAVYHQIVSSSIEE